MALSFGMSYLDSTCVDMRVEYVAGCGKERKRDRGRPSRESSQPRRKHVCSVHVCAYTKVGSVPEIYATGGIDGHCSTVSCSFEGTFDGRWQGQFRSASNGMRLNGLRYARLSDRLDHDATTLMKILGSPKQIMKIEDFHQRLQMQRELQYAGKTTRGGYCFENRCEWRLIESLTKVPKREPEWTPTSVDYENDRF
ncbi:hypothetical protein G5I_10879 [Acromyrmex echinatior]|uniref:Uncharacterized protein n=1 Tax=Acromyrmex echinatior TaxID=103372 RepID=F4WY34_ACREC|nr:hypothetical protein G5I_10879 [Acromyrmex echinatior]